MRTIRNYGMAQMEGERASQHTTNHQRIDSTRTVK